MLETSTHRMILLVTALTLAAPACKTAPPEVDEQPVEQATSTPRCLKSERDPWASAEAWIASPAGAPEEVTRVLSTWPDAAVARIWRAPDGSWRALVASSGEPGPDEPAIELTLMTDADGWKVGRASLARATRLWPEL